jgi:hypothetical protein
MSRKRLGKNPLDWIQSTREEAEKIADTADEKKFSSVPSSEVPESSSSSDSNSASPEHTEKAVVEDSKPITADTEPAVPSEPKEAEPGDSYAEDARNAPYSPRELGGNGHGSDNGNGAKAADMPASGTTATALESEEVNEDFPAEPDDEELELDLSSLLDQFPEYSTEEKPKYLTFEEKISVLFRGDQVKFLSQLERIIMRNRSRPHRKERITKNTVLRAMVDFFQEWVFDYREIADEETLRERFRQGFRREK